MRSPDASPDPGVARFASLLSWAEIDESALRANARWFRRRIGPDRRLFAVVKADAYGHGLESAVAAALAGGADAFAVAHAEEGVETRAAAGSRPPILVFAPVPAAQARLLADADLAATVGSAAQARALGAEATRQGQQIRVHVNADTGMGRLGTWHRETSAVIRTVAGHPGLRLEGVYSHLSCADNADRDEFTRAQAERFAQLRDRTGRPDLTWHLANSAGAIRFPAIRADGVRMGIAWYGARPAAEMPLPRGLTPALAWRARVSFARDIPRGRTISYGASFTSPRRMRLATVAVGYADGYPRAASGRAQALVEGRRCPVVGRVTMDQLMIDVTGIPGVRAGTVATLIGRDGDAEIRADELAGWAGTISYEALTSISRRVPRTPVNPVPRGQPSGRPNR